MDLATYQPLAMRTAKIMADPLDMLVHGAMGCGSEPGELAETAVVYVTTGTLNKKNVVEELGDCVWFATYIAHVLGFSLHTILVKKQAAIFTSATVQMQVDFLLRTSVLCGKGAEILTQIKAHKFYGKELIQPKIVDALEDYTLAVFSIVAALNLSVAEVLSANIAKLEARYPDKYSDIAAVARADKIGETCSNAEDPEQRAKLCVAACANIPTYMLIVEDGKPVDLAAVISGVQKFDKQILTDTAKAVALHGLTTGQTDKRLFDKAVQGASHSFDTRRSVD